LNRLVRQSQEFESTSSYQDILADRLYTNGLNMAKLL